MKEFWLAILKNVITYVVMIIIIVVSGITIMTQKFPPDWEKIRSAVTTLKNAYVSIITLRQSMSQQMQPKTPESCDISSDEELRKQVLIMVKKNQELIQRMDKIQTYLAGLNQYLVQITPRQPVHVSSVQQQPPPPTREPSSAHQQSAPAIR